MCWVGWGGCWLGDGGQTSGIGGEGAWKLVITCWVHFMLGTFRAHVHLSHNVTGG